MLLPASGICLDAPLRHLVDHECDVTSPHNVTVIHHDREQRTFVSGYEAAVSTLEWRHNALAGVSNLRRLACLPSRLFRRTSKEHQISALLAFLRGIHRWPVNSPHKRPVTNKMFFIWWRHHEESSQGAILCKPSIAFYSHRCVTQALSNWLAVRLGSCSLNILKDTWHCWYYCTDWYHIAW